MWVNGRCEWIVSHFLPFLRCVEDSCYWAIHRTCMASLNFGDMGYITSILFISYYKCFKFINSIFSWEVNRRFSWVPDFSWRLLTRAMEMYRLGLGLDILPILLLSRRPGINSGQLFPIPSNWSPHLPGRPEAEATLFCDKKGQQTCHGSFRLRPLASASLSISEHRTLQNDAIVPRVRAKRKGGLEKERRIWWIPMYLI